MLNAAYEIERLLQFGQKHNLIGNLDKIVARNGMLDLLGIKEPYIGEIPDENMEYPTEIISRITDYAGEKGIFDKDIYVMRELFDTKLMGLMMPRQSEVIKEFEYLVSHESVKAATEYFYHLCTASNYIRTAQIANNIKWEADSKYGSLEITINLTKPEKDPKTIAMERLQPQSNYPKCMLCIDNIGYAGRVNFPARQTHRVVPVTLCDESWFLQYSPYVYYNEHCIVFSEMHVPMTINKRTFEYILSFVSQFPHYLCGSNADLPIVGGSILSHNHFQGGNYLFPMQKAQIIRNYNSERFIGVSVGIVKWPLSVIRAASSDIGKLVDFSDYVLNEWRQYSDSSVDVLAFSDADNGPIPHNTITPIARVNEQGLYEMDLVLRNNRTTEHYPDGIFHPHKEIHHIKKENIGLIEVMGLAILPGRLKAEMEQVKSILCGTKSTEGITSEENILFKHKEWVELLVAKYGTANTIDQSDNIIKSEIGKKFETCLEHTGVFKQNESGLKAFDIFMSKLGFK